METDSRMKSKIQTTSQLKQDIEGILKSEPPGHHDNKTGNDRSAARDSAAAAFSNRQLQDLVQRSNPKDGIWSRANPGDFLRLYARNESMLQMGNAGKKPTMWPRGGDRGRGKLVEMQ